LAESQFRFPYQIQAPLDVQSIDLCPTFTSLPPECSPAAATGRNMKNDHSQSGAGAGNHRLSQTQAFHRPKVSVYIPTRNYGRFMREAIDSVFSQTMDDWEILIFLDCPMDESEEIAWHYAQIAPNKVRVFKNEEARGLQYCANRAIQEARGDFIMRLDADDYLDENALLVLSAYLIKNPEIALVYPNYFYVGEGGELIDVDIRKKIGREVKVLDLPAHGACTMIRKRVLKSIGGYDESLKAQDGYDIWLRIVGRYPVANVSTPLFFYRQHGASLSRDTNLILSAQSEIRAAHVNRSSRRQNGVQLTTLGLIGAKYSYPGLPGLALREIKGKPLIDYTVDVARNSEVFDQIVVTTDAQEVIEYCEKRHPDILVIRRPPELCDDFAKAEHVIHHALEDLEAVHGKNPDIVAFINSNAPLLTADHVKNAVNTLQVHNTDSVVSVYEDSDFHYIHGSNGLTPVSRDRHMQLRFERDALYADNRAIRVAWREAITKDSFRGSRVGHFLMPMLHSYRIRTVEDFQLVRLIIENVL
tara:strand:+ start:410 stop:1999 length:1590 start_codon:yes stop_codon:yes gene_type:complete